MFASASTAMSGEPFAQLFEQLARLREQAAANVAGYEKGTQVAQEKLNWPGLRVGGTHRIIDRADSYDRP
jgi:hypothetical protein